MNPYEPEPGVEVVEEIPLPKVRLDGGAQRRERIDPEHVAEMAQAKKLPPIKVCRDQRGIIWPWDAFHRLEVARIKRLKVIVAHVRSGSQRDAVLLSCGANPGHGLKRTNGDKQRAVETILADPEWSTWSNVKIAEHCAVDEGTVRKYRAKSSSEKPNIRTVTRDGTEYTMRVGNIGQRMLSGMSPDEQLRIVREASAIQDEQAKEVAPPRPRLKVVTATENLAADLRVLLTLPKDLADTIDTQARRRGVNRERMCVVALEEYFAGDGWKPNRRRRKAS